MIDPVFVPAYAAAADPMPTGVPHPPVWERVGDTGHKTLWVVFFIMLLSTLAFMFMALRVPVQKRLFHVLTACITLFATISYFAMATGDGGSWTRSLTKDDPPVIIFRRILWARYVDWSVTTPLLLLDLALIAGLNGADITVAIVADVVMVLTGLFAAFGRTEVQTWGYYAMGCVAYLLIVWIFAVGGRKTAQSKDAKTANFFGAIGLFTLILWTLYPIVWGLGEGSGVLTVDSEIIAYAILDVLAKPGFGFWLLITHAYSTSTSTEGFWSHGLASEGALRLDDEA